MSEKQFQAIDKTVGRIEIGIGKMAFSRCTSALGIKASAYDSLTL